MWLDQLQILFYKTTFEMRTRINLLNLFYNNIIERICISFFVVASTVILFVQCIFFIFGDDLFEKVTFLLLFLRLFDGGKYFYVNVVVFLLTVAYVEA